ncbi:hypothetical protein GW17_00023353 [Ensete ventricosum]|nr:hypothetical protein GW17_00023353 [Ensete ventricosum]
MAHGRPAGGEGAQLYHPVSAGPHTVQLSDRYVPGDTGPYRSKTPAAIAEKCPVEKTTIAPTEKRPIEKTTTVPIEKRPTEGGSEPSSKRKKHIAHKAEKGTPSQDVGREFAFEKRSKSKGKELAKEAVEGQCRPLVMKDLCPRALSSGMERTRHVTYEFGYGVVLECFWVKHPDLIVEENLFADCPEDANVEIENNHPFDDSVPFEN